MRILNVNLASYLRALCVLSVPVWCEHTERTERTVRTELTGRIGATRAPCAYRYAMNVLSVPGVPVLPWSGRTGTP